MTGIVFSTLNESEGIEIIDLRKNGSPCSRDEITGYFHLIWLTQFQVVFHSFS